MVVDLLDAETLGRLIGLITLMVIAGAAGYAKGFKEGKREGFARGKAIRQHVASLKREIYSLPSDIKAVK